MSDTDIVAENETVSQNALAPVVIDLIRALSMERDAHESTRVVLREAVTMMGEQDRRLDRERASRLHLLKQYRAMAGGHTNGDQRQNLEPTEDPRIDERRQAA